MLVVLGIALTACAGTPQPGVKVRSLTTELGLGVVKKAEFKPLEPPTLPPLQLPPVLGRRTILPPLPDPKACPEAGLFDFPGQEATPDVLIAPLLGTYRWKTDFTVRDAEKASEFLGFAVPKGTSRVFGERSVNDVQKDPAEDTAVTLLRDPRIPQPVKNVLAAEGITADRGTVLASLEQKDFGIGPYRVHSLRRDRVRIQKSSYGDTPRTFADHGEHIASLVTFWSEPDPMDASKTKLWAIANTPPAVLVTMPIAIGKEQEWSTSGQAVNALTLSGQPGPGFGELGPKLSVDYKGVVTGRKQVDACGDLVDSWLIDGAMTVVREQDGVTETLKFDYAYAVAPQIGGLIVYERLAYPSTTAFLAPNLPDQLEHEIGKVEIGDKGTPDFVIESSIGSLSPR